MMAEAQPPSSASTGRLVFRLLIVVVIGFSVWGLATILSLDSLRTEMGQRAAWGDTLQLIAADIEQSQSPTLPLESARQAVSRAEGRFKYIHPALAASIADEANPALRQGRAQDVETVLSALGRLSRDPDSSQAAVEARSATVRLQNTLRARTTLQAERIDQLFQTLYIMVLSVLAFAAGTLGYAWRSREQQRQLEQLSQRLATELDRHRTTLRRLERAQQRYELVAQATEDGLWDWNLFTGDVFFSARWWAMIGREATDDDTGGDQDIGQWLDRIHPDNRPAAEEAIAAHRSGQTPVLEVEYQLRHEDGTWRWMLCRALMERQPGGQPSRIVGSQTDISSRVAYAAQQQAQAVLKRSQQELRQVISAVPHAMAILRDGVILYANPALGRILGCASAEELLGRRLSALIDPLSDPGELPTGTVALRHRAGRSIPVELTSPVTVDYDGAPARLIVGRDLTEKQALEIHLRRADRMASLGRLAAGLAHQINNPLTVLLGNLHLVSAEATRIDSLSSEERARLLDRVDRAQQSVARVRDIVGELRSFAASGPRMSGEIDVQAVITSTLPLVTPLLRGRARITRVGDIPPPALGAAAWLGDILLNLLSNAAQAIDPGSPDDNRIVVATDVGDDGWIHVDLPDSGRGIPDAIQDRIFEPFFTTRHDQDSAGLGLFLCQNLLRRMGGTLQLHRSSSEGSVFRVRLRPASDAVPLARQTPDTSCARVLLIDDEHMLTEVLVEFLLKHDVTVVHRGEEALVRCAEFDWDIILCDIMLPDLSGMDIYQALEATRPELCERMVFITGGAVDHTVQSFLDRIPNRHLLKPLDFGALVSLVDATPRHVGTPS